MKFKFNAQTSILVAGLVAATYAEACNFAQTSMRTVCYTAGSSVDKITWKTDGSGGTLVKNINATADWVQGYQNGAEQYLLSYVTSGGVGTGHQTATPSAPSYCFGSAEFLDPTGHTDTVPYWQNGIIFQNSAPGTPASGGTYGTTTGSQTCM